MRSSCACRSPRCRRRIATGPPGSQSKLRTFRDGFRILRTIFLLVKEERPLQFFSGVALALALAALVLGWPLVTEFLRTGLVPRLPTAILATGLMMLGVRELRRRPDPRHRDGRPPRDEAAALSEPAGPDVPRATARVVTATSRGARSAQCAASRRRRRRVRRRSRPDDGAHAIGGLERLVRAHSVLHHRGARHLAVESQRHVRRTRPATALDRSFAATA